MSIQRPNGNGSTDRLTVPCGKCPACLSRKRSEWSFRLQKEVRNAETAYFVTITYNNENTPLDMSLNKEHVQLFLKRLRQLLPKAKLRYYLVGEYGSETKRPHYHAIFFNIPFYEEGLTGNAIVSELINKAWKMGFSYVGTVTPESINYVTKYMINNSNEFDGIQKPFALMSRRPGIGNNYLKLKDYHRDGLKFYGVLGGNKVNLPRYYKSKFFDKSEINENNEKIKNLSIEKEMQKREELIKRFEDPGLHELEIKRQYSAMMFKKSKNNKL